MAILVIQSGKHKGKQIVVPVKEVLIGRDEGCFIRLFSSDISRQHCALRATPDGIVVRDLGSGNGTHVNDSRIFGERLLGPGDSLRVGPVEFEVPGARIGESRVKLDEEIAEWLTDSDTNHGEAQGSKTTIITKAAEVQADSAKAASATPPSAPKPPSRPKKEFRNLAEEAQDIIRRHFEWLKSEESESSL